MRPARGVTLGSVPGDTSTTQLKDNRPSFRMFHITRTYGQDYKLFLTQESPANTTLKLESHSAKYLQSHKISQRALHVVTMEVMHITPLYMEVIHSPLNGNSQHF